MIGFIMGALVFGGRSLNLSSSSFGQVYIKLYSDSRCKSEVMVNASTIASFERNYTGGVLFSTIKYRYYLCTPYDKFKKELKKSTEAVKRKADKCQK